MQYLLVRYVVDLAVIITTINPNTLSILKRKINILKLLIDIHQMYCVLSVTKIGILSTQRQAKYTVIYVVN